MDNTEVNTWDKETPWQVIAGAAAADISLALASHQGEYRKQIAKLHLQDALKNIDLAIQTLEEEIGKAS